jgi:hypothetical protein
MPPNTPKFRNNSTAMVFGDFNAGFVKQIERRRNGGAK